MFKGKVVIYNNKNGKEQKIEKEFDNKKDYETFVHEHNLGHATNVGLPREGARGIFNFVNDILDRRIGLDRVDDGCDSQQREKDVDDGIPSLIDMSRYKKALNDIQAEKRSLEFAESQKKQQIEKINKHIKELEEYKRTFRTEGRDDLVKEVEDDIKKAKEHIKKLES